MFFFSLFFGRKFDKDHKKICCQALMSLINVATAFLLILAYNFQNITINANCLQVSQKLTYRRQSTHIYFIVLANLHEIFYSRARQPSVHPLAGWYFGRASRIWNSQRPPFLFSLYDHLYLHRTVRKSTVIFLARCRGKLLTKLPKNPEMTNEHII